MPIEAIAEATAKAAETAQNIEGASNIEGLALGESIENVSGTILSIDMEAIQTTSLESIEQSNIDKEVQELSTPEFRDLTENEKQYLRENNDIPDNLLNALKVDENNNYKVKCINEKYKNLENPDTGVRYVEKSITVNGIKITIVVPEFPSVFDVEVPPELWKEGDTAIFKYCTEKLNEYLNANPEAKANFTPEQLNIIEQICSGKIKNPRIPGFTWHHSETPGIMQLVDFKIHFDTRHTGGDFLWCGGIR